MNENDKPGLSRRELMARGLVGLALAGLPDWFVNDAVAAERERNANASRRIGPNDKIRFGAIGMGGSRGGFRQGLNITKWAAGQPGCEVAAVCDVDRVHREEAAKAFGPNTPQYNDFRELLARKDIDAVTIGTPDHWHAVIAIAAMKAGKDVYCEKPLTLTIAEGRKMVEVARKTGRVFQTGSQQRSDGRFRLACELVRNGRIGKLKRVEARLPGGAQGGPFQPQPIPEGFDWDMWLGPAPKVEYVRERTHGSFRHWYEYSGGMMTDWGAHHNDIAQWGLGMDDSGPIQVESTGKPPEPQCEQCYNAVPQFDVTYTYPNGVTLHTMSRGENGVRFEGEDGWIFVSRSEIKASDPRLLSDPLPANAVKLYASNDHMRNFVDCMRTRERPICDVEVGHRSVSVCHLGNISLRLGGRKLEWDPKREQFKGNREANKLVHYEMRKPWRI